MIEVVQFRPEHLDALRLQATQASAQPMMNAKHGLEIYERIGLARTAMLDGEPIACAGLIELWKDRAYAWAYLGEAAARHFKTIHRAVLEVVMSARWKRIEMCVDVRDPGAKRWAHRLGFDYEGTHRGWTIDGRDVECWARVTCKP